MKMKLIDTVFTMTVDKTEFSVAQDGVMTEMARRGQFLFHFGLARGFVEQCDRRTSGTGPCRN